MPLSIQMVSFSWSSMGLACDQVFKLDGQETFGLVACHAMLAVFSLLFLYFLLTGCEPVFGGRSSVTCASHAVPLILMVVLVLSSPSDTSLVSVVRRSIRSESGPQGGPQGAYRPLYKLFLIVTCGACLALSIYFVINDANNSRKDGYNGVSLIPFIVYFCCTILCNVIIVALCWVIASSVFVEEQVLARACLFFCLYHVLLWSYSRISVVVAPARLLKRLCAIALMSRARPPTWSILLS